MALREDLFSEGERTAQQRWGDPGLWTEARIAALVWDHVPERFHARIEAAPFFFLATSDREGRCDCAFKGGGPGLVRMLAPDRLTFPHFAARVKGNGAYSSLGTMDDAGLKVAQKINTFGSADSAGTPSKQVYVNSVTISES